MNKGEDFIGVGIIYLCHDGKGNFLLHKRGEGARDENGKWDIGGGALEFGEKVDDTLKREIKEEYGTDVLSYEFIGFRDVHREKDGKSTHWIALDFKVLVDAAKVKNGEPHKFDDFGWFTIEKLPLPLHSQLTAFFEKYKSKL